LDNDKYFFDEWRSSYTPFLKKTYIHGRCNFIERLLGIQKIYKTINENYIKIIKEKTLVILIFERPFIISGKPE
jgi:hypothetical protein